MLFILCTKCSFGIRVHGAEDDIANLLGAESPLHGVYQCPACHSLCMSAPYADSPLIASYHLRDVTPFEAHLVFNGMGFPEERDCVAEVVVSELIHKQVKSVVARTVPGTTRTSIDTITLADGTTLFLSGSAAGAIVYRVRKPSPYVRATEGSDETTT